MGSRFARYGVFVFAVMSLFAMGYAAYTVETLQHLPPITDPETKRLQVAIRLITLCLFVIIFGVALLIFREIVRIRERQYWFMDAVNARFKNTGESFKIAAENFENLFQHVNDIKTSFTEPDGDTSAKVTPTLWPWGTHHTEALGHLEAAARKWWLLYDPTDRTTAPTNDMVSEWLQNERGLSQKMADSLASILRPSDLPTGRRK